MGLSHVVTNVLRKPVLSGPLESDIGIVRHMSEIATENKVYSVLHYHKSKLVNKALYLYSPEAKCQKVP